jgi:hypothetical protein
MTHLQPPVGPLRDLLVDQHLDQLRDQLADAHQDQPTVRHQDLPLVQPAALLWDQL